MWLKQMQCIITRKHGGPVTIACCSLICSNKCVPSSRCNTLSQSFLVRRKQRCLFASGKEEYKLPPPKRLCVTTRMFGSQCVNGGKKRITGWSPWDAIVRLLAAARCLDSSGVFLLIVGIWENTTTKKGRLTGTQSEHSSDLVRYVMARFPWTTCPVPPIFTC